MEEKPVMAWRTVPEEIQTVVRRWDEIDKSQIIGIDDSQAQRCIEENGEIVVIPVDAIKARIGIMDLSEVIDVKDILTIAYDDEESLPYGSDDEEPFPPGAVEELANKKLYGKDEIMQLLGCGKKKALNFLKLLFQMEYAIKIGKSYIVTAENFDRFMEDFKGKEIAI